MSIAGRIDDVVLPWRMRWNGCVWSDMPGATEEDQKLNFALFRRGMLELEMDEETGEMRSAYQFGNIASMGGGQGGAEVRRQRREEAQRRAGARPPLGVAGVRRAASVPVVKPVRERLDRRAISPAQRELAVLCARPGLVGAMRVVGGASLQTALAAVRGGWRISPEAMRRLHAALPQAVALIESKESEHAEIEARVRALRAGVRALPRGGVARVADGARFARQALCGIMSGRLCSRDNLERLERSLREVQAEGVRPWVRQPLPGGGGEK